MKWASTIRGVMDCSHPSLKCTLTRFRPACDCGAFTSHEPLKWTSWGSLKERTTGMFHRYKEIVTLSAPKTVKGRTVFTTARVVFHGISEQSNRTSSIE